MCTDSALLPARTDSQRGATLVELIIFIVIVSVALAGILLVMNKVTGHSADTLVRKQALAVAESLLEEVELHDFSNPSGGFTGAATQANRPLFDDVMDYNGFITTGIYPANGSATAIPGLENYNVAVTVANSALGAIPAAGAVLIAVTVIDPSNQTISMTGYRTAY